MGRKRSAYVKRNQDGVWEFFIASSKTDRACEGRSFKITGDSFGEFSMGRLLAWYWKKLGVVPEEGCLFPLIQEGIMVRH